MSGGWKGGPATRDNPPECPVCRRLMMRSTEAIMADDVSVDAWACADECQTPPHDETGRA